MMRRHPPVASESVHLPDKLFYKIGEVSRLTGIPAYILRYWETEFEILQPKKSRSGQRLYRKKDVETVLQIKQLLYRDGFTIAGAKARFRSLPERQGASKGRNQKQEDILGSLRIIREGLERITCILNNKD
jgi:DNA-binding transcriptional MerR regulator